MLKLGVALIALFSLTTASHAAVDRVAHREWKAAQERKLKQLRAGEKVLRATLATVQNGETYFKAISTSVLKLATDIGRDGSPLGAKIRDASEKIQLEVDQGKLAPAKAIRQTVRLLTEALRNIRLRQVDEIFAPHETEGLIRRFLKSMMKWAARRSPGLFLALHGEIKDETTQWSEGLAEDWQVLSDTVKDGTQRAFRTSEYLATYATLNMKVFIGQARARGQTQVSTSVDLELPGRKATFEFPIDFSAPRAEVQAKVEAAVVRFKRESGLTDAQFAGVEPSLRQAFGEKRFAE
jgi:hypothetical protein